MTASFPSVIWLCAVLAALPASPCRLMGGICDVNPRAAVAETRSCCAEHAASESQSSTGTPSSPCSRQCCKIGPAIPVVHDSVVDAELVPAPVAFSVVPAVEAEAVATSREPLSPVRSMQILHCRWRV